jgi:hypothetical protein
MRSEEELAALHREAVEEFKKYPGVVGIAYGYKVKGGEVTQQLAVRVYVREKKDAAELPPEEMIPPEFKGFPTDVIKAPRIVDSAGCEHTGTAPPLVSGISLSNLKPDAQGEYESGTLGFFATIDGVSGPDNVVLVSCFHVLMAHGASPTQNIYRPKYNSNGKIDVPNSLLRANVHNVGMRGNHPFKYGNEQPIPYWVDATSAKINVCLSSWCNTNCGTNFKNEVRDLHIGADTSKVITGVKRLQQEDLPEGGEYLVYKVGRATGLTVGKVTAALFERIDDPDGKKGLIEITATEKDCGGAGTDTRFSFEGDSGSAVLNSNRELIGIIVSRATDTPEISYASHIHPVLDVLKVTPITKSNPHPADGVISDAPGVIADDRPNHTPELRARVYASRRGRELLNLVEEHRDEVVRLVNRRRPVTVAWHRSKGPAFLAHVVQGARDPSHEVPREIEGITREALIRNMARVFATHGSAELKALVEQYLEEALMEADRFDRVHEVVEHIEEFELV